MLVDEVEIPVEFGKIRELARATLDPDPAFQDAGPGEVIDAPLTYTVVAGHYRDSIAAVERMGLDLRRIVVGEVRWDYLAPVRSGDVLSGSRIVSDVREREGRRGGSMTFVTMRTEFRNQAAEHVLTWTETLIERGG